MTKEDIKYFANCLKNGFRIDSNTMEMFCNEVIDSQNKLQRIENIIKDSDNVEALEQESILHKVRREIKELDDKVCQQFLIEDVDKEVHHAYQDCITIIDKYK